MLATDIYNNVNNVDWPMAAVSSYALLALAAVALAVFGWLQRRAGRAEQGGVTAAGATPTGVRGWGIWLLVVYAFVLLPPAIIVVNSFSSVSYGTWPPPGLSTKWVRQPARPDRTGLRVAVPVANPYAHQALTRSTPLDGVNINRIFPGNASGSVTEQVAAALCEFWRVRTTSSTSTPAATSPRSSTPTSTTRALRCPAPTAARCFTMAPRTPDRPPAGRSNRDRLHGQ